MKSILRHQAFKSFSTSNNKLYSLIQKTAENLQQQNTNNYLKYEEIFFKLYTVQLEKQKKVNAELRRLDAICMINDFPCKSIVEHFYATSKIYNEDYVVQTFVRLAKAYKISQSDNASTADYSIHRLFFTPAFENLIEQFKYGLRKQNTMKWENAFLVAECLIDIGYVDYEVFSILLNIIETKLNKRQRNQNQIRFFQIQKKDYYMRRLRNSQPNIVQDSEFNAVIKMLHQKVKSDDIKNLQSRQLSSLSVQMKDTQQNQTIYQTILDTIKNIESYNSNLTKLIEGIITIRKQYRKMVVLSESKDILRNPELNLELLALQQTLLLKKLINLSDIKNTFKIEDQNNQLRRVEEVLISLIEPETGDFSSAEIAAFLNTNSHQVENKQAQKLLKYKEIAQYGRAMSALSRFSQVSRRLYNAPDGRSLISMKWEKTLIKSQRANEQTDKQFRENLHAEKIFRRTFVDLFKMMKRSYSIFMFTFIEAPLKYKIQFFEALSRLGLYEEVINLLESQDTSKEKFQAYSQNELYSLFKVLNEVGTKINSQNLKKSALKQLKKLYEDSQFQENKSLFNMDFCINSINFICQNFNVVSAGLNAANKDEIQVLYDGLVNRLAEQTKYYEESENFLTDDNIYEAYRILSMQRQGEYKLDKTFYQRYHLDVTNKKELQSFLYKKNPFFFIVNEMCQKYQTSQLKENYPFIPTGYNRKGILTGVLVCSSDCSSINGKYLTGNLNAFIARIKREYDVEVTPLTVNSLLEIDYDKIFENKQFSFKSKQQIEKLMSSLFKRDELNLHNFSRILMNISSILQRHFKRSYLLAVTRFMNSLNQCIRLYDREKQIFSFSLFKSRRYRLFIVLDSLKQDYNLIDKQVKDELEKQYKKQTHLEKHSSILDAIQQIQKNILQSIGQSEEENTSPTIFEGKRFSIDSLIQDQTNQAQNIGYEFINTTVYADKTFCPYNEWNEALNHFYPLHSLKLAESSNLTKILVKKYLPKINESLSILPFTKKVNLRYKSQFTLTSLDPIKQSAKTPLISENQAEGIKQLLSFIHELKISKSENDLVQYLFSFDFIDHLHSSVAKNNNNPPVQFTRNAEQYLTYLESRNTKLYLQSPNLDYLFTKLEKNEIISELFSQRKFKRNNVKIQYQLGQINRKEYFSKVQKVDDEIIQALKTLQQNVLDNVENKILDSGLKMIRIQKDEEQLERVLNSRARFYERTLDKDYIYVKGNIEKCLKIKRNKAERQLSLYKIIYKLSKGQSTLSDFEKQFLKKEASYVTFRLQNKRQHGDTFNQKFTHLTINDLSKADKQRLKLGGSDLSAIDYLPLSEVILQLVNLLDSKVQQNFEKWLYAKFYSGKNIPGQIFASQSNKEFSVLVNMEERAIINEKSKLDNYEKGILEEMVKTFKTEAFTGKQRFTQFYDTFNQDINEMNQSEARVQLISEYLNLKEIQFSQDNNPRLVEEIKQRQVMKLWNVVFRKPYNESTTEIIKKTVPIICDRVRLMGDNSPPFFGLLVLKILSHPSTDILSKQNLISCIQYYKAGVKIDSEDIRVLAYGCSSQQRQLNRSSQELLKEMSLVSNKNFMENLNKKIDLII